MNAPVLDTVTYPARAHSRHFRSSLGTMSFLACLLELIKNARDKRCTRTWINTRMRSMLSCRDNSPTGMSEVSRRLALDLGDETASPTTSSFYNSGLKRALASIGVSLRILTAPSETPDVVFEIQITDGELFAIYEKQDQGVTWSKFAKTTETWPYEHPFGTLIEITFANPASKEIRRGDALARILSRRLLDKMLPSIFVDDVVLPAKQLVGGPDNKYVASEVHPELGPFSFELYRQKDATAEDRVRFGDTEVGEAMASVLRRALGELGSLMPDIYTHPALSGTIICPWLKGMIEEDRKSVNAKIADQAYARHLLAVLRKHAFAIQQKLGLHGGETAAPSDVQGVVQETLTNLDRAYGSGEGPDVQVDCDEVNETTITATTRTPRPLTLTCNDEAEIGERVLIQAQTRSDFDINLAELVWYADDCGGTSPESTPDGGFSFYAAHLGYREISAEIPNSPFGDRVRIRIVEKRAFRINTRAVNCQVGDSTTVLMVKNRDKATVGAEPVWTADRPCKLVAEGWRAKFSPTEAGMFNITVRAGDQSSTCSILVTPKLQRPLTIGEHRFRHLPCDAGIEPPVQMEYTTGEVHNLRIDLTSASVRKAMEEKRFTDFFLLALALEYARFCEEVESDASGENSDADGLDSQHRVNTRALQLYFEFRRKKP